MPDMRYLNDKDKFVGFAHDVFGKYFESRADFDTFFQHIEGEAQKNRFLKLASFYKFLIRDGKYVVSEPEFPTYIDYLDETYKFIALFSLIEALYAEDEFEQFFSWLMRRRKEGIFPVEDHRHLEKLHTQYKSVHGFTQKLFDSSVLLIRPISVPSEAQLG